MAPEREPVQSIHKHIRFMTKKVTDCVAKYLWGHVYVCSRSVLCLFGAAFELAGKSKIPDHKDCAA